MRAAILACVVCAVLALAPMAESGQPQVTIYTDRSTYQSGDTVEVSLSASNDGEGTSVDVYVGLVTSDWEIYTFGPAGWSGSLEPWIEGIYVPGGFTLDSTPFWWIDLPSSMPPIIMEGDHNFASVLTYPGTLGWTCDLSLAQFSFEGSGPAIDITMIAIPAGSFPMGSPPDEEDRDPDEGPQRTVNLSAFLMSETEVTEKQWEEVMGWNDCYDRRGDDYPVENVTWFDCVSFCNKLSELEGFSKCYAVTDAAYDGNHIVSAEVTCSFDANGYRLPTEAEWEYACRAGTTTKYYTGTEESDLGRAGWYYGNSAPGPGEPRQKRQVGQKEENAFALFDMHGNVWEWCWDRYASDYYGTQPDPDTDPTGPGDGEDRVLRGGCWNTLAIYCRAAFRNWDDPNTVYSSLGLRVVRSE